jgi:hypothetical protein
MNPMRAVLRWLVLTLVVLAGLPGSAYASHLPGPGNGAGPDYHFKRMFPSNLGCSLSSPGWIDFPLLAYGLFMPAHYCVNVTSLPSGPAIFSMQVNETSFPSFFLYGPPIATISGTVTCFNPVGHAATDVDLITSSNSLLFPLSQNLVGKFVDNNSVSQLGNQLAPVPAADSAGMILVPIWSGGCPPPTFLGVPIFPASAGSIVIH